VIFLDKITKLKLPVSKDINTYAVKEIKKNSNHLIGINFNKEIAILFDTTKPYSKGDALEYIQLVHNQKCIVKEDKNEKNKNYSVLKCSINNQKLKELFLKLLENIILEIPNKISQKDITDLTRDIFDLFEKISKPSRETLVGLWGELFVINSSKNTDVLIQAWHPEITDKFDFFSQNQALEIKTTTSNDRIHNFSYEQLNVGNEKLVICSIMLRQNRDGKSLEDLKNEISSRIKNKNLKNQFELIYYQTIGEISEEDINEYKFDNLYAEENIRYFDVMDVPRLKEKPMAGVKKIKFQSDLTGIKSLNQFDEDTFYSNLFLEN
jgi:hypothetical protein